jgi:hypothetical protein
MKSLLTEIVWILIDSNGLFLKSLSIRASGSVPRYISTLAEWGTDPFSPYDRITVFHLIA